MNEKRQRGRSQDSEFSNPKASTSSTTEEPTDVNLTKSSENYFRSQFNKLSRHMRNAVKTEKEHPKPMLESPFITTDEQNDDKFLTSTDLGVPRSKEQACSTLKNTVVVSVSSTPKNKAENILTTPRSIPENKPVDPLAVAKNLFGHPPFSNPSTNISCYNMYPDRRNLKETCYAAPTGTIKLHEATPSGSSSIVPIQRKYLQDGHALHSASQCKNKSCPKDFTISNNSATFPPSEQSSEHDIAVNTVMEKPQSLKNSEVAKVEKAGLSEHNKNCPKDFTTSNISATFLPSEQSSEHDIAVNTLMEKPQSLKNFNSENVAKVEKAGLSEHNKNCPKDFTTNNISAAFATSARSEQSSEHDNAAMEKPQILKNFNLQKVAKVEAVPSEHLYIGNQNISSNDENESTTNLSEWDVVDDNIPNELTMVNHDNANLEDFQNHSPSFPREDLQAKHNLFVAKGNYFAERLENLPEKQAKEAEEKMSRILYELEIAAYLKKLQDGNLNNPYPYLPRKSLGEMCQGTVSRSPNRKSPSPRMGRGGGKSPQSQNLYPVLSEIQNGDWDTQRNIEPMYYGHYQRQQPSLEDEFQSEEVFPQDEEMYPEDEEMYPQDEEMYLEGEEMYPEDEEEFQKDKNYLDEKVFRRNRLEQDKPPKSQKNIYSALEREKRQPPPTVTPKQSRKKSSPKPTITYRHVKKILYALGVILIALTAFIFGPSYWPKLMEMLLKTDSPPQPTVATIMENLRREFSEQPPMTFKIVNSALKKVTKPEPEAPAIIVLFAELGAEEIAGRFARKIADSVSLPESIVIVSGHSYQNEDPDVAKKDIDNLINENLREDQLRAVLVDRLDYIPLNAAIVFHTYCDHENAPFKRVVYVMTIASKKTELKSVDSKGWDVMVQDHLYESWREGGNDQVSSLLSRLTVSVAAIVSGG